MQKAQNISILRRRNLYQSYVEGILRITGTHKKQEFNWDIVPPQIKILQSSCYLLGAKYLIRVLPQKNKRLTPFKLTAKVCSLGYFAWWKFPLSVKFHEQAKRVDLGKYWEKVLKYILFVRNVFIHVAFVWFLRVHEITRRSKASNNEK